MYLFRDNNDQLDTVSNLKQTNLFRFDTYQLYTALGQRSLRCTKRLLDRAQMMVWEKWTQERKSILVHKEHQARRVQDLSKRIHQGR